MEQLKESERKLSPQPDASWRIEEVSLGGYLVLTNLVFFADTFPLDISSHLDALVEVRCVSYFDGDNRLMRQELWRIHKYDKEYWRLTYEGVYVYGKETAELTYWEPTANKVVTSLNILDKNGFLVEDSALKIMLDGMPFGHAIEAKYKPEPSWKRFEEAWTSDDGNHKSLNVTFMDESNEFRRFERWNCDCEGKPSMLVREDHVKVIGSKERQIWSNKGGYLLESYSDAIYLTSEGERIPPKRYKAYLWVIIALVLAGAVALAGFLTSGDDIVPEEVVTRETVMPIAGEEGTFIPHAEIPIRYDNEFDISLESVSFTASNTVINWKVIVRSRDVDELTIDPIDYKMLVYKAKGDTPMEVAVDNIHVGSQTISSKTTVPITEKQFSFTTSYPELLGYMYINFPNMSLYSNNAIKVAK